MIPDRIAQAKWFFSLLCWTLLLEKWPLGNSKLYTGKESLPEARLASQSPRNEQGDFS